MSSSASSSMAVGRRAPKGRRRHQAKSRTVSQFFNPLAGRPGKHRASLVPQLKCELAYETTSLVTTSTTVPVGNALNFNINSASGSSEYLALFDQYRIDEVECWIEPVCAQGTTVFGGVVSCVDLDDANVGSFAQVSAHQGALIGYGGAARYHRWQPHAAIASYSGAFTSFANEPSPWCDSGSPSIQHFGLKIATEATPGGALTYRLSIKLHCSFRAPGI